MKSQTNRRATLEVSYTQQNQPARKEATLVMSEGGDLVKQNLLLHIWNLRSRETETYSKKGIIIYRRDFYDGQDVNERTSAIATAFDGTHSKLDNLHHDHASFGIEKRDDLVRYLVMFEGDIAFKAFK